MLRQQVALGGLLTGGLKETYRRVERKFQSKEGGKV
jgi:hypothetical protein